MLSQEERRGCVSIVNIIMEISQELLRLLLPYISEDPYYTMIDCIIGFDQVDY